MLTLRISGKGKKQRKRSLSLSVAILGTESRDQRKEVKGNKERDKDNLIMAIIAAVSLLQARLMKSFINRLQGRDIPAISGAFPANSKNKTRRAAVISTALYGTLTE